MKKGMWKWTALCLGAAVLGGCGSDDGAGKGLEDMGVALSDGEDRAAGESPERPGGDAAAVGEENGDSGQSALTQAMSPEKEAMYKAYVTVLEDIYFDRTFPGGADHGDLPEGYDIAENRFAVWDIDSDGREELLLSFTGTYSAGKMEIIYDYDSSAGSVREELLAFPSLTYYDNGVVEEPASHNHGMAGDGGADGNFWPYSLHRYDPDTDAYVSVGSVEAWSRRYREQDDDGNPFPEEADADGDGVVYFVMEGNYCLEDPMDGGEYRQWRDSYLKGAKPLEVPYVSLTTDNIYAVGKGMVSQDPAGRQILEQTFAVDLDGWGEVTFAPFAPEGAWEDKRGRICYRDVRFALQKDGKTVFALPGENEDNVFYGKRFGQVLSVAFRDYNEDGRPDILVILEYAGVQEPNIDAPVRTVRAYFQEEGTKEFSLDKPLSDYLQPYADSMEKVSEGIESYAGLYSVATDKSAWEVERFARKVKRQILAGDFQGLCREMAFPISVDGIVYPDEEAFLAADFIRDIPPDFLETVRSEPCGDMFANYQGVAMERGCVWISEILDDNLVSIGLKVNGLNGLGANAQP